MLVGAWRLLRVLLHVLHGAVICAFVFPFLEPEPRRRRVGWFAQRMLVLLDVAVDSHGTPHAAPCMLVANHVSWLDILVINSVRPVRFVSKADVRAWPVLGRLVTCGGTLYIERERKRDAMRVVHQVADALKANHTIAIFPEGTTSAGHGLLPFHANLLQAAIVTGTPVQPLALRYADDGEAVSAAAAYVGDMNLVESVWAVVTAKGLRVRLDWLPAVDSRGLDRRALSEVLRGRILQALTGPAVGIVAAR